MCRIQPSLAAMIGFVLVLSVDLAALAEPSEWSATLALLLTILVLLVAILGARFGGGLKPFWWGLALFGWAYLILAFGSWSLTIEVGRTGRSETRPISLSTSKLLVLIRNQALNLGDTETDFDDPTRTRYVKAMVHRAHFNQAGHAMFALLFGLAGGLAGSTIARQDHEEPPGGRVRGPDLDRGASSESWIEAVQAADPKAAVPVVPILPLREP